MHASVVLLQSSLISWTDPGQTCQVYPPGWAAGWEWWMGWNSALSMPLKVQGFFLGAAVSGSMVLDT